MSSEASEASAENKEVQRVAAQDRTRTNSTGDNRWRTSSFSQATRVVVIPVDSSPNAKYAFNYYLENMHRPDDLVVITHIPEPPSLPSFTFRGGLKLPADKWKEIMDDANAKIKKLEGDYENECIRKKIRYKVRGEYSPQAGPAICHIAENESADVVVMGCRGLGPIKKAVLGSVSDYVVRHTNRPVLVVPYPK